MRIIRRFAAPLFGAFALAAASTGFAATLVALDTSAGRIVLELDETKAPKTVANFVQYVKAGHYDGTIFHRVIDGFMIQGGGFTDKLDEKPTRGSIENEGQNGLKNQRGTIAMARTNDPNSASAQFFINVVDNKGLDYPRPDGHGYAVFGRVVEGMDVVDRIKSMPTHTVGPYQNVPSIAVVIKKASVQAK